MNRYFFSFFCETFIIFEISRFICCKRILSTHTANMSHTRNPNRKTVYFTAGPSALPYEVLEKAQEELLNYGGLEASVMGKKNNDSNKHVWHVWLFVGLKVLDF